ncbi:MAG TPA: trypsin-like peptidase domain-containing protein [Thermoleophilaceae bacterium]
MPVRTPTPPRRSLPVPSRTTAASNLLSGIVGGLVVLALGATMIGTGVINTGDTRREIIREVPARGAPLANAADTSSQSVADIYRRAAPGVVFVTARVVTQTDSPFGFPLEQEGLATGSGFVLDRNGYILTNAHVVEGAKDASVRFEEGGDLVDARVVGRDVSTDLAVLKVNPGETKLKPLPLGNSSRVRVGDPAIAIGNPFGYDRTVTTGIISALQRQIKAPNGFTIGHVIQTDAPINPGNSGGPLLNAEGQVIGINSQIATAGSRGSVGIGFAVPINTAKKVVPQLERHGQIVHAYLGVTTYPLSKDLAAAVNLSVDRGALIQEVTPGGPAARGGLHAGKIHTDEGVILGGDVIVEVDGERIAKPDDVAAAISDNKPGETVEVKYYRDNRLQTKQVKLGTRPPSFDDQATTTTPDQSGGSDLVP